MQKGMVPEYAILGSFGEVRDQDGNWVANAQSVEFTVSIDKKEIFISGSRKKGYKAGAVTGEGTLSMLKVTSRWLQLLTEMMRSDNQIQFVGQLIVKVADPESLGVERVALKDVKFWEYKGGWKVDELIEEELPFTYSDIELLDVINPEASFVTRVSNYTPLDA